MLISDYTLRLAQKHVEEYARREEAMDQHRAVMKKCDTCESFLCLGINAYRWLKQADDTLREAAREGLEVPEECRDELEIAYRDWLKPCPHAERLIEEQQELGYKPENLEEFKRACEDVKKQVRLLDMDKALDDASRGVVFDAQFWAATKKVHAS
jgi:hypothetical protein